MGGVSWRSQLGGKGGQPGGSHYDTPSRGGHWSLDAKLEKETSSGYTVLSEKKRNGCSRSEGLVPVAEATVPHSNYITILWICKWFLCFRRD